eukprot:CAMPEP_0113453706 /NCGR_PEP_ID=MMETSP0014_2-20120614/7491_1 /TAXON_ID=2857 /ORGANISM="Nitzschia sp." /LENGTH=855 /DNA_ID=CAMNT_0000345099 /DNA_START=159 /DNA_END=2726 /DNA_ORIENTATION=+ /assembly_acc=CAM_ASM_000159
MMNVASRPAVVVVVAWSRLLGRSRSTTLRLLGSTPRPRSTSTSKLRPRPCPGVPVHLPAAATVVTAVGAGNVWKTSSTTSTSITNSITSKRSSSSSSSSIDSSLHRGPDPEDPTHKYSPVDLTTIQGRYGSYLETYQQSVNNDDDDDDNDNANVNNSAQQFWLRQATQQLSWFREPTTALVPRPVTSTKGNASSSTTTTTTTSINNEDEEGGGKGGEGSSSSSSSEKHHLMDWFPDGTINMSHNCLDVHLEQGRGEQVALVYDSPVTPGPRHVKQTFTYKQLHDEVCQFASALQYQLKIQKGDVVILYMPLIPQAVIAMLACSRIGAVHSVVFGGFSASELANRINHCQPKALITASCGIEPTRIVRYKPIVDEALRQASSSAAAASGVGGDDSSSSSSSSRSGTSVEHVVVVQRSNVEECSLVEGLDVDYDELISKSDPTLVADAVPLPSTHPHYILYTSGTTGLPKGMVRDVGGHATALKWSMSHFYDLQPGDTMLTASDIGWVVGHSYIVYGPLLHGCTTILYEGKPVGTPDAGSFWRLIQEYGAKAMFTAPTAFRAMKQVDPDAELAKQYDLTSLKNVFVAGEHCDPETLHWLERSLPHVPPPIDHWWQTELGWPAVGNAVGLGRVPVRYGSCSLPVPGFKLEIFDDDGQRLPRNQLGNLAIRTPLPPGSLRTIYKDDQRYIDSYLLRYPGYYETGDAAYIDDDGYVYIMGRTDDVINTAGHRLSTGGMEEILLEHPNVSDCAVIPVKDELKGQIAFAFVVCSAGTDPSMYDTICDELVVLVRKKLGPVAAFKNVTVVKSLPKTRSGKILRGTMSKIANGENWTITPTIEDPTVFDHLEPAILGLVAKKKL